MVSLPITNLNNDYHRPIAFNLAYDDMRLLFDTGATIPVWTAGGYNSKGRSVHILTKQAGRITQNEKFPNSGQIADKRKF